MIRKFGPPDVMKVEEVEMPAVPDIGVLVRVRYSSVNPVDWRIRNGSLKFIYGSRFPMKLGFEDRVKISTSINSREFFKIRTGQLLNISKIH